MTTPIDTAKEYAAALNALGVRTTYDPRKVVPPTILITPPTVAMDSNCGGQGDWTAYALAATSGNSDAWSQLDGLVAKALEVLPVENVSPAEYGLDESSSFPAFQMTWTESVNWRA